MERRPLLDLLSHGAYPEVAAVVRARSGSILQRWEALVREALPRADELTFTQLRDDMPQVLEQIARSLESDRPHHTERLDEMTSHHGETRFHQSFNLDELLIEYSIFRTVVMDEVVRHRGAVNSDEVVSLNAAIDVTGRRACLAFVSFQAAELKAATEAQSKYLSFLSHDLRGGLNGVFLMIEVLRRELSNQPQLADTVEDLDVMRRSLLETVATMDRFLHAERFRKGKVQVKPGKVNLKLLLSEAASQLSYQAKDKGIDLRVDAPPDCTIVSDRELLSLIFQNLISNAVKYAERGVVDVQAVQSEDGGCLVSVRDQGPGIEPERLSELFAPYARGETHGKPGVGLGLSIARQAAQMLGAKLWAESQPGQGSTFHVQLPKEIAKTPG